jgi:hypothetical protein
MFCASVTHIPMEVGIIGALQSHQLLHVSVSTHELIAILSSTNLKCSKL